MKILRAKIQDECKNKKIAQPVIEKDYILSYMLVGISKQADLSKSLIFKGGTALKKLFFGDYRFSEDLDFSTINAPKNTELEMALNNAISIVKDLLSDYGPFEFQLKRNPERAPHPHGQEAFIVLAKFPWQQSPMCRIKIEITHDEPVILKPIYKSIIHGYEEDLNCRVTCYALEEIVAEKMRCLLQTHKKLIVRGWNRPRVRDYYDLWCILKKFHKNIDGTKILQILDEKCRHRDVSYQGVNDFFTGNLLKEAYQHWQVSLGPLVKDLPKFELVIEETKFLIKEILTIPLATEI